MGNQNPPDNSVEKVKSPRPTLEEISKMELKDSCPHCGWRVEPNSKHSKGCRYYWHPDYNLDRNVSYKASPAALKHSPALIILDLDLPKTVNTTRQDQNQPYQEGRSQIPQQQGVRGQNTQDQGGRGYNRYRPPYDRNEYYDPYQKQYNEGPPPGYYERGPKNLHYYGPNNSPRDYCRKGYNSNSEGKCPTSLTPCLIVIKTIFYPSPCTFRVRTRQWRWTGQRMATRVRVFRLTPL